MTKGLEEYSEIGTTTKAVSFFDDDALKVAKKFCASKLSGNLCEKKRVNVKRFAKRINNEITRRSGLSRQEKHIYEKERLMGKARYELIRDRNRKYKESKKYAD
jgi:hypothetical protein